MHDNNNSADHPQLYLISPAHLDVQSFSNILAGVLEEFDIACFRLALSSHDEELVMRAADACRTVCHKRDVAIVLDGHAPLSQTLGLDGVHLGHGASELRSARKLLGPDAIIGAYCGNSRHDGLSTGEAGADYIAFGPLTAFEGEEAASHELFAWWSEMIELPVVAEGGLNVERIAALRDVTDFFAIGEEIWASDDPIATLKTLHDAMIGA